MIENVEQVNFSALQLNNLRQRARKIETDPTKDILFKEMELAGIRGMIDQIEKEIRLYHLTRFQKSLKELQVRSQKTPPEKLPELFAQMIGAMEEFTTAIQPII